jgi:hypothetical protein|tara:strand:+ start:942 stop:1187 length:246 start_codon:yes stop_codon:yes gene_type:complete
MQYTKTLQNNNIKNVYDREALSDAIIDLGCVPNDLNSISQQLDDLYYQATKIQHTITLVNKELIRVIDQIKKDSDKARYSL